MTILVVEDNENLAYGLATTLELEGYRVVVAGDGNAGLRTARELRPDLVVLDLMLPGMDGYRVLKSLREDGDDVPVLILTARGEEADKVLGFRLGADDYVTKPFGRLELVARVEALLRRAGRRRDPAAADRTSNRLVRFGPVEVDLAARTVSLDGQPVALTLKEFDLLAALIRRQGAVATRLELLQEVWGHRAAVVTRTVDMHVAELRRKLEPDPSRPTYILTVYKVGYRLAPDGAPGRPPPPPAPVL
ncbi:MAG: response regulator transcription factor [Gemmatimonadetes bacterium]|nr:response regulator transcription factor [Gemmatimonadota bacterium]